MKNYSKGNEIGMRCHRQIKHVLCILAPFEMRYIWKIGRDRLKRSRLDLTNSKKKNMTI